MIKLDAWARKEYNKLPQHSYPIFLEITDKSWLVGSYTLTQLGQHSWQLVQDDKIVHIFYSKQAAVFYAVFTKFKQYSTADNILTADRTTAKLKDELDFYTGKLAKNRKSTDSFKLQLWQSRYVDTKTRFQSAREELEKRLNSAKYNKIWDKII